MTCGIITTYFKTFLSLVILLAMANPVMAQKQILVYTRNGEGYVHDNRHASARALVQLGAEHNYQVMVSDDPYLFSDSVLASFDCIIFSNTNNEAFVNDKQRLAFQKYIRSGGGFVGVHSASGSERDWPWFAEMLGGRFVRHPKLQTFSIKVVDPVHPATSFMEDAWQWTDECYFLNHLNPDISILLAADLSTIEDHLKNDYPGQTFGNYTPIAWYHEYDGGRQFYTALGHKIEHYSDPFFIQHLLGGIQWVLDEK